MKAAEYSEALHTDIVKNEYEIPISTYKSPPGIDM
jgi:hypothetical protein